VTTKEYLALSTNAQEALVAKHVFGCKVAVGKGQPNTDHFWQEDFQYCDCNGTWPAHGQSHPLMQRTILPYTSNMERAWEVVEQMRRDCCCITIRTPTSEPMECEMVPGSWTGNMEHEAYTGHSDPSAPMAICIAALKVKGVIVDVP
jgi:hypothetical protein